MKRLEMQSKDIINENINNISKLFPNCISEGKIDFEILKQELVNDIIEEGKEKYQINWVGKCESKAIINQRITKTLRPIRNKSLNFNETKNIYIEGDNLEVLKILQESYLNKIKLIYIDPPYNTGNDFIYNDNYSKEELKELRESGQIDEYSNRLVTNTETNGKYHSDWMTMIFSRIKLARNLLSDDGVIFISIDDNEHCNLKKICDEIFGENNFIATIPWRKRTAKSDVPFGISQDFEWIVCYAKTDKFKASIEGKERKYYKSDDFPNDEWRIHDMTKQTTASERPNSFFTMVNPKNGKEYPCDPNKTWRITKETFQNYYKENKIIFPGDYKFLKISKPVMRYFKSEDIQKAGDSFGRISVSTKLPDGIGMSQDGTKEIKELFGNIPFPFPKPVKLIKYLIEMSTSENDIILDFFSGSATTSHAIMQLNAEKESNRKYILVQLPEKCNKNSEACKLGFETICEIGEERIRRAGKKIKEETNANIDYGFRVYKVDSSNMKDVYYAPKDLKQSQLNMFESNVKEDRTAEDLLTQVILDLGLSLDLSIEEKKIINNNVYFVESNSLVACFDDVIDINIIDEICKCKPLKIVFKESSFKTDNDKINTFERIKKLSPETEVNVI